jgi:hypothetical protein
MESPGMITDLINDTRHLDAHPGTMNYKARLEEAQKIHNRNIAMAARLDNIKPFYGKTDLTLQIPLRRKNDKKNKKQQLNKVEYHIQKALQEIENSISATHNMYQQSEKRIRPLNPNLPIPERGFIRPE